MFVTQRNKQKLIFSSNCFQVGIHPLTEIASEKLEQKNTTSSTKLPTSVSWKKKHSQMWQKLDEVFTSEGLIHRFVLPEDCDPFTNPLNHRSASELDDRYNQLFPAIEPSVADMPRLNCIIDPKNIEKCIEHRTEEAVKLYQQEFGNSSPDEKIWNSFCEKYEMTFGRNNRIPVSEEDFRNLYSENINFRFYETTDGFDYNYYHNRFRGYPHLTQFLYDLGFSFQFEERLNKWILTMPSPEYLQAKWDQKRQKMPGLPELKQTDAEGIASHLDFANTHTKFDLLVSLHQERLHDMYAHALSWCIAVYRAYQDFSKPETVNLKESIQYLLFRLGIRKNTIDQVIQEHTDRQVKGIQKVLKILEVYAQAIDMLDSNNPKRETMTRNLRLFKAMIGSWVDLDSAQYHFYQRSVLGRSGCKKLPAVWHYYWQYGGSKASGWHKLEEFNEYWNLSASDKRAVQEEWQKCYEA
ncbi:MAG: hypothetical protein K940chlam9_00211 [Chlamydiae bacterium]|nr:hypothetical protein [Chlamydiota bacterium]